MSRTSDIAFATATELLDHLRQGTTSAVAVAQSYLDRVAQMDARMHGFAAIDAERVLVDAARVDERRRAGDDGLLLRHL